jgi:hypothetical protein
MRACKKDSNHDEVKFRYQFHGWVCIDTFWSAGRLLDFIAYDPRHQRLRFVEVKNGKGNLTEDEKCFFWMHPECSRLIRSVEEAEKDAIK